MVKDTLEQVTEPNLDLRRYLQHAYVHPVFETEKLKNEVGGGPVACDEEETNPLVPTKRTTSNKNTPAESKHGSEVGSV